MKNKRLFTKQTQPDALEFLGYLLVTMTVFFLTMSLGFDKWENYAAAVFVAAIVSVTYTLFVKYSMYETLTSFLCRLAGKPHADLNKRERITYGVIGMTLFIPGILAMFTMPYLLQTSFGVPVGVSYLAAIPFAFLIFLVDRAFVATMGYKKQWGMFFMRFAIAGLLGWFLAQPIELQFFQKEIQEELATQGVAKIEAIETDWQAEQARLDAQEATARAEVDRARSEYEAEINTSIAGRVAGHGPEAKKKLAYWEETKTEFDTKKATIDAERSRLEKVFKEKKKTYSETKSAGLGAQIQALHSAGEKYPSVALYHWIIVLAILCVDLSPLLVKFFMRKTPSDRKAEEEDMAAENHRGQLEVDHKYKLMTKEFESVLAMIAKLNLSESERKSLQEGEKQRIIKKYYGEDALHDILQAPVSAN